MRRTWLAGASFAWIASTAAFVSVVALGTVAVHLMRGDVERIPHSVVDASIAFGVLFAVVAAAVHVPVFSLVTHGMKIRLRNARSILLGAFLGIAPFVAVIAAFREHEDPQTVGGWLAFWATHLPEFLGGVLPFVAAGAVFGAVWSRRYSPDVRAAA